jgi:hypothetical protein
MLSTVPSRQGNKTSQGFRDLISNPKMCKSHENGVTATSSVIATLSLKVKDALGGSLELATRSERHFSLSGPSIRLEPSRSSLRLKDRAPSSETTASKSSAYRHALLKPSVIAWQSLDLRLPIQPVLINAPDMLPSSGSSETYYNAMAGHSYLRARPSVMLVRDTAKE